jgi:glutathione S-transferase
MAPQMILHYAPDNASLCVRLALLELDLPFRTMLVDRSIQAHKKPDYLALNPNGLIPTLETAQGPIYETGAILLWLADQKPGDVFPTPTSDARCAALRQLFWLSNTVHTTMRRLFYPALIATSAQDDIRNHAMTELAGLFDMLEADQNASWLDTDTPSILACYFAPLMRWPRLYGDPSNVWLTAQRYPRLFRFAKRFEMRDTMRVAAQAEGLGPTPISAPHLPNPPEGTAT